MRRSSTTQPNSLYGGNDDEQASACEAAATTYFESLPTGCAVPRFSAEPLQLVSSNGVGVAHGVASRSIYFLLYAPCSVRTTLCRARRCKSLFVVNTFHFVNLSLLWTSDKRSSDRLDWFWLAVCGRTDSVLHSQVSASFFWIIFLSFLRRAIPMIMYAGDHVNDHHGSDPGRFRCGAASIPRPARDGMGVLVG